MRPGRTRGEAGAGASRLRDDPDGRVGIRSAIPARMEDLRVNGRVVIPAAELSWAAVRASGPGGQNVNKVASKVDLRFDVAASRVLSAHTKNRLRTIARGRIGEDGALRVICQETRDQRQNLARAREHLAELIREALAPPPPPRRPTKPTGGSKRRRLAGKRRESDKKRDRKVVVD